MGHRLPFKDALMLGDREVQEPLFIPGSLRDLIPDDHIL